VQVIGLHAEVNNTKESRLRGSYLPSNAEK